MLRVGPTDCCSEIVRGQPQVRRCELLLRDEGKRPLLEAAIKQRLVKTEKSCVVTVICGVCKSAKTVVVIYSYLLYVSIKPD
jgi:hypothetical protein